MKSNSTVRTIPNKNVLSIAIKIVTLNNQWIVLRPGKVTL